MSTEVFIPKFVEPRLGSYDESMEDLDDMSQARGGRTAVLARASKSQFRARGTVRFPQIISSTTYEASWLLGFKNDRQGRVDTFLYEAQMAYHREVVKASLGTGDGSTTVFAFSDGTDLHKHILNGDHSDDTTLLVYVNDVLQTVTTHYTVSGNDTDPTITFVSAPTNTHPITVSYRFYVPVRFAEVRLASRVLNRSAASDLSDEEAADFQVSLIEDRPGARYA